MWGGSKKESSLAGNVGSKIGGDYGVLKLNMNVQSSVPKEGVNFKKHDLIQIEPTSLDSILGKNSSSNVDAEPSTGADSKKRNTHIVTTTTESTTVPVHF